MQQITTGDEGGATWPTRGSLNPCAPSTRAGPEPCGIWWHRAASETPFPRIVSDIGEHRVA